MKLKHYLTISHFLVLIITLLSIIIGIEVNVAYNRRTRVKDDLSVRMEFIKYREILNNPDLYNGKVNIANALSQIVLDKETIITLYSPAGLTLYSSVVGNERKVSLDNLYSNLNEVTYRYNIYTLKKAVFDEEANIIGFYEMSIERHNLAEITKKNTLITFSVLFLLVGMIFIIVIRRLNIKFSQPLSAVTHSMNEYAKGNTEVYINYKANDEIGELCRHFNAMKDEIEEGKKAVEAEQKAKEYMIATISHDLKTPLTSIRAYTEMLKLSNTTDEVKRRDYLETILSKCDYMRDMLDDLLTYNLLSMNYQLTQVEVEGDEFCEMLYSGVEATCRQKDINVEIQIEAHGNYSVDVKYMTRVIDNIVSNAIRHTKENGNIWLGAFSTDVVLPDWVDVQCADVLDKYRGPGLFLIVKNEGNAISERDRENLFKPFYQGDEARSKKAHKGVGLGLSISKMIIEKHKGAIEVIPINGVGNIMVCYLRSTSYEEESEHER
ncbi:MAG: HAMP domain-containing histidine kinase [Cellulosilyticum sp.]|nr:HAMP domain-containing histidine kinase [Cellulosilyticum sp.]